MYPACLFSSVVSIAGDNYWNLAKEIYGDGFMWKKISEANPGLNPNKLPIGGTLTIPPKG